MVRRVLGGGCGFCDEDQILFSIIASEGGGMVPTDIQGAYSRILGGLINTLRMLGFDGKLEPTRNAVYSQGRKISGNAQGRFEGAVLVNGSFLLDFGFDEMDRVLKNPTMNLAEGVERARDGMITLSELLDGTGYDIDHVKGVLKRGFEDALGVEARRGVLAGEEIELAQRLNEKHRSRGCSDYQWAPNCSYNFVGAGREVVEKYIPTHKIYDHNRGLMRKNRYIQAQYICSEYTITAGWLYCASFKSKKSTNEKRLHF